MMKGRISLTIIQINDSHAYCDLHQEMFWQGDQAVYHPAGGYARHYDQIGGYVKRSLGLNAYIKIENPPGQRVQQIFVGDEELQPGRYYLTTFVTEQGVAQKYGRNRQHHTERSIEALRAYLARHRPLRAELRGTFVAV